jgi:hypothetical protein
MSNWVAYNAIDEMKRLEPELDLLREIAEAAKYWRELEERGHGGYIDKASRRLAHGELWEAIGAYEEWEQDL